MKVNNLTKYTAKKNVEFSKKATDSHSDYSNHN